MIQLQDELIDQFLKQLYSEGTAHDAVQSDRRVKRLNITPSTGEFLDLMVREANPQRILEIGTSNGYSTIWLARAARSIGASLVSLDAVDAKTKEARRNLQAVDLADQVKLLCTNASGYLADCEDWAFDFVFLDADRLEYTELWPQLKRVLKFGTLIVDNATSHPSEIEPVRKILAGESELASIVLPIGKGQLVVRSRATG